MRRIIFIYGEIAAHDVSICSSEFQPVERAILMPCPHLGVDPTDLALGWGARGRARHRLRHLPLWPPLGTGSDAGTSQDARERGHTPRKVSGDPEVSAHGGLDCADDLP